LVINFIDDEDDYDDEGCISVNTSGSDGSDDTSDEEDGEDDNDNSRDYDSLPFDTSSQTETEEEPLIEEDDSSSELEPEDENITYGKRYVKFVM
jgi:hypothetical protein